MLLDVYVDRRVNFERTRDYKLHLMLEGLRRESIRWRILDDPHAAPLGSCAFLHVDLTDVPQHFLDAAARYQRCINAKASTIRRTLYSTARLMPGSDWPGPVIVKTILNSRGLPERRYRSRAGVYARLAHIGRKLANLSGDRECPAYSVYPSLADVPDHVWNDERLMAEKFLPGDLELVVTKCRYNFLLDVGIASWAAHPNLLCAADTETTAAACSDVPGPVLELRRQLNLDFGSIDYFMADGLAVPVDANKTTTETAAWIRRHAFVPGHMAAQTQRLIDFVRKG